MSVGLMRLRPYPHQEQEYLWHRGEDRRAMLWQMRTGKTKSALDLACHRHAEAGDITGLLVLAPNGVHTNWVRREVPAHAWECAHARAHAWSSFDSSGTAARLYPRRFARHAESLEAVLSHRGGLAVLAVNSEALIVERVRAAVRRFLAAHGDGRRVMLAADESHDFRTPSSDRSRLARELAGRCRVVRILTGTVVANSPLAAWAQFEMLEKGALGFRRFTDFKGYHARFVQVRSGAGRLFTVLDSREPYPHIDELRSRMAAWSSVILRRDCEGLPDLMPVRRPVELTPPLLGAYSRMLDDMLLELGSGAEAEANGAGARLLKLQQIASGFVVDRAGAEHDLVPDEENPKLRALRDEAAGTDGKLVVWCRFQHDIAKCCAVLRGMGMGVVEYHGKVPQGRRQEAIDRFQGDPSVRAFVGQPQAGGVGINLSAASAVVWYSHTFDLIVREQGSERATQVGGRSVAVVDLAATDTVDDYILASLERKRALSDSLAGEGLRACLTELREMLG